MPRYHQVAQQHARPTGRKSPRQEGKEVEEMTDKFGESEQKQICDTVNKQRRLVEMYNMKQLTDGNISEEEFSNLVVSSEAVANLILCNVEAHPAKTVKAATNLMGATLMAKQTATALADAKKAKETAKAAPKKKAAKAKK